MPAQKGVHVLELTAGLLIAAVLGLMIRCLVQTIEAPRSRVRNLPVWVWQVLLLVPVLGPLAWLAFGRPRAGHRIDASGPGSTRRRPARWDGPVPGPHHGGRRVPDGWPVWPVEVEARAVGPDDDPSFIADLARRVEQLRYERGYPARTDDGDEVI